MIFTIPFLVTKEELSFRSDFVIQATRKDMVHAFVVHWDCEFTHCHTSIGFSTAPSAPYTHWKQTVFYLEQDVYIAPGDKFEGSFEMKVPFSTFSPQLTMLFSLMTGMSEIWTSCLLLHMSKTTVFPSPSLWHTACTESSKI